MVGRACCADDAYDDVLMMPPARRMAGSQALVGGENVAELCDVARPTDGNAAVSGETAAPIGSQSVRGCLGHSQRPPGAGSPQDVADRAEAQDPRRPGRQFCRRAARIALFSYAEAKIVDGEAGGALPALLDHVA